MPSPDEFCALVWEEGRRHERQLPWRYIDDAYAVLVSEVMLQQTQVSRVLSYWERFLRLFPTIDALASASTTDVLLAWKGLGYNSRGLALKRTADICSERWQGNLPRIYEELVALPGIGPTTAAGVLSFAFGLPSVYLETNVRTVFLHELFAGRENVRDREIVPYVEYTCSREDPRGWYYALLDYGAHLKAQGAKDHRRSASYARQSAFEGSRRQKRSFILDAVVGTSAPVGTRDVYERLNEAEFKAGRDRVEPEEFRSIVDDLVGEGFFARDGEGEDAMLIPW